jgi:tetratricopeptide (TPR) repeat protein
MQQTTPLALSLLQRLRLTSGVLEERVRKLLEDRTLLEKYRKSQRREKELLANIGKLENENRRLQTLSAEGQEQKKKDLKEQFHNAAQALTAVEWNQKALALVGNVTYTDPRQAIEYLDQAIKLDPTYPDIYNNRGIAYHQLGRYQRAIEDYDRAIRLHPGYAGAYHKRGVAYLRLHDLARACLDWRRACGLGNCEGLTFAQERGECR